MRDAGRLAAAIEILADFDARRVPLKTAIADWSRGARYAGAKDRAWISGLCLDALRRRRSLAHAMGEDSPRAAALGAMRWLWGFSADELTEIASEEPHGPGALSDHEASLFSDSFNPMLEATADAISDVDAGVLGDYPEWLEGHFKRAFCEDAAAEGAALAGRADIDLRLNTLKAEPEKSLQALSSVKGVAAGVLKTAARVYAPPAAEKAAAITVIPAFNKGWVEVQDLGSQIAAAAAGDIAGKQVLDFCAGAGGKTLALAALMNNTGQLYAYDIDARRLKPLYDRAKRAGVRNLQIINPLTDEAALAELKAKMDVVFVDAPCTGSGTWRRHPDTKWRLTEAQFHRRLEEQAKVLRSAAEFVKPGGKLVYVTCSFFVEENQDRLDDFLRDEASFSQTPAMNGLRHSGLLAEDATELLERCANAKGALQLTPARARTDGFFVSILEKHI